MFVMLNAYATSILVHSMTYMIYPMLEFIARIRSRIKKNSYEHSIQQAKIARLIKDQIFTSNECAKIYLKDSPRARFTLAKVEPLRSFV